MKSINHLEITGVVASVSTEAGKASTRFTLVHNFGGGKKALYIRCRTIYPGSIRKNDTVTIKGYLQSGNRDGAEVFIQDISIESKRN